jgi:hypothetical protein
MTTLDRCLESLAYCHMQDELLWTSARLIVQQDIDAYVNEAGPDLAAKLEALHRLMDAFDSRFGDETDPVLIRSTMRRHIRRIEFDLKREADQRKPPEDTAELPESPETAPATHADDRTTPAEQEKPDEVAVHGPHRPDGDAT